MIAQIGVMVIRAPDGRLVRAALYPAHDVEIAVSENLANDAIDSIVGMLHDYHMEAAE